MSLVGRGPQLSKNERALLDQIVQIRSLRQNYVPNVYSPIDLVSDNRVLADSFRVREDGAIKFDALTSEGLTYTIRSVVPDDPLSELASVDGDRPNAEVRGGALENDLLAVG